MKQKLAPALIVLAALLVFSGCAGAPAPSSSAPVASSPPAATSAVDSTPSSAPSQPGSISTNVPTNTVVDTAAIEAMLATVVEAAGFDAGTISVAELDLRAGGLNTDNIAAFAGAEAKNSAQNGGIVLVIQAAAGQGAAVADELEIYKQNRLGNPDYAEFEQARTNTENARIVANGDVVVYAVSALGDAGWSALDEAIAAALAA